MGGLAFESSPSRSPRNFRTRARKSGKARPYSPRSGSWIDKRLWTGSEICHEPDFAVCGAIHLFRRPLRNRGQMVRRAGAEEASGALGFGALVPLPRAPLLAIFGLRAGSDWRRGSERCDVGDRVWRYGVSG